MCSPQLDISVDETLAHMAACNKSLGHENRHGNIGAEEDKHNRYE